MLNNMSEKLMNMQFSKVEDAVWDLTTGRLGVKTTNGIATCTGEGDDAQIDVNIVDSFGMPIPAFAQAIPISEVKLGDIVFDGKRIKGWVVKVKESVKETKDTEGNVVSSQTNYSFSILTPTGTTTNFKPPRVQLLGMSSGVKVLRSLVTLLPNGEQGLGEMNNLLPMMAMMSDGDSDLENMLPMLLMSQMTGNSSGGNMLQTLLMMKMMGGKGMTNNFFGDV